MDANHLINSLIEQTKQNMNDVQSFKKLPEGNLNYKPGKDSWSVLECIEHLNRYGDFYIPEIRKRILNSTYKKSETFKSGLLGNYFAESMLPKDSLNKIKTFKSMNPNNSKLEKSVLDKFTHQQEQILELLNKSQSTNLTKIKTAISISKWIKLRLGDTFRVLIYHNQRHLVQAKRVAVMPTGNTI